jgi:hypothetical protein
MPRQIGLTPRFNIGGVLILLCIRACDSVVNIQYATSASIRATLVDVATEAILGNMMVRIGTEPRMYGTFTAADFGRSSVLSAPGSAMNSGVVISTGDVASIGAVPYDAFGVGTDFGARMSADGDQAFLEVSFSALCATKLSFRYVFASRELPEFGGTKYNDKFMMNVSPGISGTGSIDNIAVLPPLFSGAVSDPVSINALVGGSEGQGQRCCRADFGLGKWRKDVWIPNYSGGTGDQEYSRMQQVRCVRLTAYSGCRQDRPIRCRARF